VDAEPTAVDEGPKVTPYSRLPKRIDRAHMEALWTEAAHRGGDYSSHLWVTVLALLYGTGLRRGELERLNMDAFDRREGTLRIDGRKTGRERCVPMPDMVLQCLEAYLPRRHNRLEATERLGETALLITRTGARLTGQMISNGIHAISRKAGVSIHSLHQFATPAPRICWSRRAPGRGTTHPRACRRLDHSAVCAHCRSAATRSDAPASPQRLARPASSGGRMTAPNPFPLDPLIEGYLSYLDKVGRKTPRTIVDVRCTLRRAITELDRIRPGVDLCI